MRQQNKAPLRLLSPAPPREEIRNAPLAPQNNMKNSRTI
jgi:hypothetical protein